MGGITVTVVVERPDAPASETAVVAEVRRDGPPGAGSFGLSLAEGKDLLSAVQRQLTRAQLDAHVAAWRYCELCGTRRWSKDWRPVRFRSLFGAVELRVPRLRRCACDGPCRGAQTVRIDSLDNRTAPELEHMQSRLAATAPYARASEILGLPLPAQVSCSASSVRRHTLAVGRRLEADPSETGPRE